MTALPHFDTLTALCALCLVTAVTAGEQPSLLQCRIGPLALDSYPVCAASAVDAPWAHHPYCVEETSYCVFTGRGVSIIDEGRAGSASVVPAVSSLAQLLASPAAPAPAESRQKPPPYEVRDIPGKGKGVVATRKISRGEVFMVDDAAIVADSQFPRRVRRDQGRLLLWEAFARLPAADSVLSLARSSPNPASVPAVEDILKTNSFSVDIGGKGYMALFPKIAVRLLAALDF